MWIYFIFLITPLVPVIANFSKSKKYNPVFWVYFLALLIFSGFRFEVGPDWHQYRAIYEYYSSLNFDDIYDFSEPGFFLLNKASEWLGTGYEGVIFFCSLIFLYGCFSYARTTSDQWLAIAAVLPYLVFIISMSGIRQSVAIGLGFYLFANWQTFSLAIKLVIIALAMSFHNSAAFLLLFVIYTMKVSILARGLLTVIVVVFVAYNLDETDIFEKYKSVYIEKNVISEGAFFHVLLIAFPSFIYLFFRKKILKLYPENINVYLASFLALGAMPLIAVSSTGIDRLSLYLSFIQMWVYPAIVKVGIANRSLLRVAIYALIMVIFFVFFMFGNHTFAYLPYKNILFTE